MLSTKAIYGRVGVAVSRNMVLTPNQSQTVRFVLPTLPLNSNCQAQYALSIIDNNNQVLADRGNTNGEFNFNFSDCRKTYTVTLVASGRYTNGKSGGNCSRTITFSVKPTCR
jgi:hypothetical protein